jgi:hypothetical protein
MKPFGSSEWEADRADMIASASLSRWVSCLMAAISWADISMVILTAGLPNCPAGGHPLLATFETRQRDLLLVLRFVEPVDSN